MDLVASLSEVAGFKARPAKEAPVSKKRKRYEIYKSIPTNPPQAVQTVAVGESVITESYSSGLMYFLKYLNAGMDPYDFAHRLEEFFDSEGMDPPEDFDPDEPFSFLDSEQFEEIKDDFTKWIGDNITDYHADMPTYLFLSGAKLVPRQTWLIHFSDDADDIARNGFQYGASEFTQLGLTTHFSDKVRKSRPGWNFAFIAGSRDARNALKDRSGRPKYGRHAVIFQSAGVQAYHEGDQENQVVFWGPDVKERYLISYDDNEGVWDISTGDGRSLYSDEDIDNVIGWIQGNKDQYRHVITNDKISKRPTSTPKAQREVLLNKQPEKQLYSESVQISNDDIGYWSTYAKSMMFPSERAGRDWLFSKMEAQAPGEPKNREIADRIPMFKQFDRWKIGTKAATSVKNTLDEEDLEVESKGISHVSTSGLVAPGDILKVSKPIWVPVSKLKTTEDHTETADGKLKVDDLARKIRSSKKVTALWVDAGDDSVMDGHHRLEALKSLGLKRVPVQYVHLRDL